jgi:hypothetical protein
VVVEQLMLQELLQSIQHLFGTIAEQQFVLELIARFLETQEQLFVGNLQLMRLQQQELLLPILQHL